jgi:hypothetical protein
MLTIVRSITLKCTTTLVTSVVSLTLQMRKGESGIRKPKSHLASLLVQGVDQFWFSCLDAISRTKRS